MAEIRHKGRADELLDKIDELEAKIEELREALSSYGTDSFRVVTV